MKRVFLFAAMIGISAVGYAQEKPLTPDQIKKENAATAEVEGKVESVESSTENAIKDGETVKSSDKLKNSSKITNTDKPLNNQQVSVENAATAIEEKKVAAEKTEAEIALAEGKEISVVNTTSTYSATSQVKNSGFQRTVGFDGAWKLDLNLANKEIILTGGTLNNKGAANSNPLRLMVYLADKPFNLNNPEFIGQVYSVADLTSIIAGESKTGQAYVTSWASETIPNPGTYYPYILLGEQNPTTQEFEVKDVKAFDNSIVIVQ